MWPLNATQEKLLLWTAYLHEAGVSIAHSSYQNHTAYLLEQSDMPGFSQLDQRFMAVLSRHHRRHINSEWHDGLPERLHQSTSWALVLLRLSVVLNRSREALPLNDIHLKVKQESLSLQLPAQWLQQHPLTQQDLSSEQRQWHALGLTLQLDH